jgi:hypothetical protein
MECFSIYLDLLWFLSVMFCSFLHRSSALLVKLIFSYLMLSDAMVNEIVSLICLDNSLQAYRNTIEFFNIDFLSSNPVEFISSVF